MNERPDIHAGTPVWARHALSAAVKPGAIEADGVRIAYREWPGAEPGLLLLHGGSAHARWWDLVAPLVAGRRVVAMDVSGHGDTSARENYGLTQWVSEVAAVVEALFEVPPLLVGHSLGGGIALAGSAVLGRRVLATVSIDSVFARAQDTPRLPIRPVRFTPTRDELMQRFRLIPENGVTPDWVRHYVGYHSIRWASDGFRWKFDPRIGLMEWPARALAGTPPAPVVYYRCEFGLADELSARALTDAFGEDQVQLRVLSGVGHNPMLDTPRELARELSGLLADLAGLESPAA
jgi:pimeloyl-ACP methyl ester carboxylesterase